GSAAPAAVLARGKVVFENNCYVCHGPAGAGNGPVVQQAKGADGKMYGRFPGAPAINGANTAARADGYIYGVIAAGRGLMPPYGSRITHPDRWAVVEYVRTLQAQNGQVPQRAAATPAPVPAQQAAPASPNAAQPPAQNAPATAPGAAPVAPAAQGPAAARP
ncbi:MAG TPA: cytochrome c, partial [Longimicrobium sp.]|nr:cytochrome c [Longimicrobium sp.]